MSNTESYALLVRITVGLTVAAYCIRVVWTDLHLLFIYSKLMRVCEMPTDDCRSLHENTAIVYFMLDVAISW